MASASDPEDDAKKNQERDAQEQGHDQAASRECLVDIPKGEGNNDQAEQNHTNEGHFTCLNFQPIHFYSRWGLVGFS